MFIMKRSIYSLLSACTLLALGACEKELATYSETDGVYFSLTVSNVRTDTSKVTFAYAPEDVTDTTILVPVRTRGYLQDQDRPFRLKVVEENTTATAGVHFTALQTEYSIPAGTNIFQLPVTLHRTADMLADTFQIQLELLPNEHFDLKLSDEIINTTTKEKVSLTRFTIQVNDVLAKPKAWWDHMLGTFSRKKILLIAEISGEPLANFNDQTLLTISKNTFLGKFTQKYLNDQAAAGNVILDEDGLPMVMGAGAQ